MWRWRWAWSSWDDCVARKVWAQWSGCPMECPCRRRERSCWCRNWADPLCSSDSCSRPRSPFVSDPSPPAESCHRCCRCASCYKREWFAALSCTPYRPSPVDCRRLFLFWSWTAHYSNWMCDFEILHCQNFNSIF